MGASLRDWDPDMDAELTPSYPLVLDSRWLTTFVVVECVPLAFFALWGFSTLEWRVSYYLKWHFDGGEYQLHVYSLFLFLLACALDAKDLFKVVRDSVPVLPRFVPKIEIDTRPSANCLLVGGLKIALVDVKEAHRFSDHWCQGVGVATIIGAWPYALLLLFIGSLRSEYAAERVASMTIGFVCVAKAFMGPDFLIKVGFSLDWLLTTSSDARNIIGDALLKKKTKEGAFYVGLACFSVAGFVARGLGYTKAVSAYAAIAAFLTCGIYTVIVSCMQSVAITPHFVLSQLATGVYIQYTHRAHCPCLHHCYECSAMHSRDKMLVVFPQDEQAFMNNLKGEGEKGET